jgi:hypothetical protein
MFRLLQGHHQGGTPTCKGLGMALYVRPNYDDPLEIETCRRNTSDNNYLLLTVLSVGSNTV